MKSLVDLLEHLLLDCGRRSAAPVRRDVKTLRARVEHEGDSFITITLPSFCQEFERALEIGRVAPDSFKSFRKIKGTGNPAFLQGFLCHVFGSDGALLNEPRVDCIRSIRQICLFGKKLIRECSKERRDEAISKFIQCDDEVASQVPDGQLQRFSKLVARIIFSTLSMGKSELAQIRPKHGPGATRERISGNQKWEFSRWHERLEDVGFTYELFGHGSDIMTSEDLADHPFLVCPEDEEPVRVVLVPKTLKSPRTIAVEPVCMQYAQQGLLRLLLRQLGNCRYTAGHVNFADQTVNGVLAQLSSGDGRLATLDMAEASDRVSVACVSEMLESVPDFRNWVLAARSTHAQLPDGTIIPLKKFASMGSALCFPMEAMIFYTNIIASRVSRAGRFPTPSTVYEFSRDVFVYGDDLIVPADEAAAICDDLESLGLKVNRHKSFWTGKFRESCGVDCYDNSKVTPVYLRRDLPADRGDVAGILSTVATCNQLEEAELHETATALRESVEAILGRLPSVPVDSPAIGWHFPSKEEPARRWNRDLQRPEMVAWVATTTVAPDLLTRGHAALAKCLSLMGESNSVNDARVIWRPLDEIASINEDHLATSPRPYGLTLKRRRVPYY